MKKQTQRQSNPFLFSDSNKRYHTYDYYLKHTFGEKVAKITLDAGFTCPNRDGTRGVGGCIYCSGKGGGESNCDTGLSLEEQYWRQRERLAKKWSADHFIAYLQSFTNSYAPLPRLREVYEQALSLPGVVGLNIATRADCLSDEVIAYLGEISERTELTLELGLQTVHDDTARAIGRGHTFAEFLDAFSRVRALAPRVRLGVHLIFGLIGENDEKMLESVQAVANLCPDEVKLHLLYVTKGTRMADIYRNRAYFPMEKDHYISLVIRALELLPPQVVVGRLTGDGDRKTLLAPLWSLEKGKILNEIDKRFYALDTWQGKAFCKTIVNNS